MTKYRLRITDWRKLPQAMMVMVVNHICDELHDTMTAANMFGIESFPNGGWEVEPYIPGSESDG